MHDWTPRLWYMSFWTMLFVCYCVYWYYWKRF
jgi:hypothetical protein